MDKLEISHLTFYYPEQTTPALDDFSLEVASGDFVVLCGPSGCGKSTLLRQLKSVLAPHGRRTGEILFDSRRLDELSAAEQTSKIGFVLQDPESQIVTDKVWHELAFGLESLGFDTPTIRRRVAEMANFFGIQNWFDKSVTELSGGQKQLLNLASIMTMQPELLILDEPTSQLDPIAASDFIGVVVRINRELGTTVIMTEHRLEEAFAAANRVAVMDSGRLLLADRPSAVGERLKSLGHTMFLAMPTAMRVWSAVPDGNTDARHTDCPVTVRDGHEWLSAYAAVHTLRPTPVRHERQFGKVVLEAENLWFAYDKHSEVVRGLDLTLRQGEFAAILGGNGAGKTTSLRLLAGLEKPLRGSVSRNGRLALLTQNPQLMFRHSTVREDLYEISPNGGGKYELAVRLCRLEGLFDRHPYDLSGGEVQRAALAKLLLTEPDILLLDEPTKGLDAEFKRELAAILRRLCELGKSILAVSHDIEFCAVYSDRCMLFFDGSVAAEGEPREFFTGNSFYTTAANRMSRGICDAVTADELIYICGGEPAVFGDEAEPTAMNLPQSAQTTPTESQNNDSVPAASHTTDAAQAKLHTSNADKITSNAADAAKNATAYTSSGRPRRPKLSLPRRIIAAAAGIACAIIFIQAIGVTDLSALVSAGGANEGAYTQLLLGGLLALSLTILAAAIYRPQPKPTIRNTSSSTGSDVRGKSTRRVPLRTKIAAAMILLTVPLTLLAGNLLGGGRHYYIVSILILLECMLPFFLIFEGRRPQARELVIISVLAAIGVAGRAVFFMLPQFKPVTALTVIAGAALGSETGFLVGAMTMLASNVMFSQGPWTPWQMFCMGIIGFLAGILFRRLSRSRLTLCIYGALASLVIYGGVMNLASALMWSPTLDWRIVVTYFVTGLPMDCVHALSTALFLWFAAEPMLEKLERVKKKYGLYE